MANDTPDGPEARRQMTTERERIREWADARDAVPAVSTRGGEPSEATFARRDELGDDYEEQSWDEFFETFDESDRVFVYHEEESTGEELGFFELVDREQAFDRTDLGRDEFEDALRRGETVTSEIVETRVVEREVVERDTIESEVVEASIGERDVVDSELLDREVVEIEFVGDDLVEVLVDETRLETIDVVEHLTVESRVVDVDVDVGAESEREPAREEVESGIEIASIQRSLLDDIVRSEVAPDEVIADEMIRSRRTEGDMVQSELVERRTVEEEVRERHRMEFVLDESELVDAEVIATEVIEGELVDVDEFAPPAADVGEPEAAAEPGMEGEPTGAEMEAEGAEPMETEEGEPMGTEPAAAEPGAAGAEAEAEPGEPMAIEITDDERGKEVHDATGQQIGIVSSVEEGRVYVDPEPGLTDRLKARLNWGGRDEEDYPVEAAQIAEITQDAVVLRSE